MNKNFFTAKRIQILSFAVLLVAAIWNFSKVFQLAIDVPIEDDWDYLGNLEVFDLNNLLAVHVQHRIVFTRLMLFASKLFDSLDFRHLVLANYPVYLAFVLSVMLIFKTEIKRFPGFILFFLPFFSDAAQTNLLWTGQSSFHFMLLAGMLAIYFGFCRKGSWLDVAAMILFQAAGTFAMSPLLAAEILGCWLFKQLYMIRSEADITQKKLLIWKTLAGTIPVIVIIGTFFINYTPNDLPHAKLPDFIFFAAVNLVKSFALFTPDTPRMIIAILTLLLIMPGIMFLKICWLKKFSLLQDEAGKITIILWGFLFSAAIAWSRNGIMDWRHTEAVLPLIPSLGAMLCRYADRSKLSCFAGISYALMVAVTMSFSFTFRHSEIKREQRLSGLQELQKKLVSTPEEPLDIPSLYPGKNFQAKLRTARRLQISCLKNISADRRKDH